MRACLFCCLVLLPGLLQADCGKGRVTLQVLGSGGPELGDGRASSSYLIWLDGRARVLVDTGAGASRGFEMAGAKVEDLEAILLTHLHVDHSVDLPSFIKAAFFSPRSNDLPVFGPGGNALMPSTSEFVQLLMGSGGAFRYLGNYLDRTRAAAFHLHVRDIDLADKGIQTRRLNDRLSFSAVPVDHGPVAAVAWRVDILGCAIAFSGDTSNKSGALARLSAAADILVAHNAIPETATGAARNLHMPPSEIGKVAAAAKVGKLILSHRMRRTLGGEALTANGIRRYYSGPVLFANDLDKFPL